MTTIDLVGFNEAHNKR